MRGDEAWRKPCPVRAVQTDTKTPESMIAAIDRSLAEHMADQPGLAELPVTPIPTFEPEVWRHDPITHRLIFPEREKSRQERKNPLCRDHLKTDLGNSERFALRHGINCLYIRAFKSWYIWDGSRWRRDDLGTIRELAKDTVIRIYDEAGTATGNVEQSELYRWAISSQARSKIDAMIDLAQSAHAISPDKLDTNLDQINFKNGTLDLTTFEFSVPRREDLITKITGCTYRSYRKLPNLGGFSRSNYG